MEGDSSYLLKLPSEIVLIIVRKLTFNDVIKFSSVSQYFYDVCDSIWRELFLKEFPNSTKFINSTENDIGNTWKNKFSLKYKLRKNWLQGRYKQTILDEVQTQVRGIACLSQDGNFLAVGYSDKCVRFFNLETKKVIEVAETPAGVLCVQLDRKTGVAVCGCANGSLRLWDVSKSFVNLNKNAITMDGHIQEVNCLLYDGEVVISGSADRTIKIYEKSGNLRHTLSGHGKGIMCLQSDGDELFSGSKDGMIRIWSMSTGECKAIFAGHNGDIYCMYLDRINRKIYSGGLDATASVWDLKVLEEKHTLKEFIKPNGKFAGHRGTVLCVKLFNEDILLTSSRSARVAAFETETTKLYFEVDTKGPVDAIDFNVDNEVLVAQCEKEIIIFHYNKSIAPKKVVSFHAEGWIMGMHLSDTSIVYGTNYGELFMIEFEEAIPTVPQETVKEPGKLKKFFQNLRKK